VAALRLPDTVSGSGCRWLLRRSGRACMTGHGIDDLRWRSCGRLHVK
jgi:hypothetical protein